MTLTSEGYTPITLADLVQEVEGLLMAIEETPPDTSPAPELVNRLQGMVTVERVKVDAIARVLKGLQAQASIVELEITELETRRARLLKTKDRLADYVMAVMDAYHYKKLEGNLHRLTKIAGRQTVELEEGAMGRIPLSMLRVITRTEPDKPAIKAALERGEEVPGATLVTGPPHLRVYT